jgi:hypothetical protein
MKEKVFCGKNNIFYDGYKPVPLFIEDARSKLQENGFTRRPVAKPTESCFTGVSSPKPTESCFSGVNKP